MDDDGLHPCPFCGHGSPAPFELIGGCASCPACGARGPIGDTSASARRAWNHRAEADRLMARATKAEAERDEARAGRIDDFREFHRVKIERDRYRSMLAANAATVRAAESAVAKVAALEAERDRLSKQVGELDRDLYVASTNRDVARRERDAYLALLLDEGGESPPLWYALLRGPMSPIGAWWREFEARAEAVAAVRAAARLPPAPGAEGEAKGGAVNA